MAKKAKNTITIKLNFTEDDQNAILKAANFGDGKDWTVKSLKKAKMYDAFVKEMEDTSGNFVDEIVDGSYDACANDWMNKFCTDSE